MFIGRVNAEFQLEEKNPYKRHVGLYLMVDCFGIVDTYCKHDWLWGMKTVGCFSDGTRAVVGGRMVLQHNVTQRERI